ncbi:LLM class F420-dependent oxidoreductase [Mycolicibacterium duvalii]|uniref:LLM class F420-dependent oxidoreductase n=2 Tax=Mycolicibacterium duvalii TaxID=39688 RepID=A0A7I7K5T9_9MYCO|nr:LLM class F420-dependent oxidoreductase [Mycolicibacterium duvalii]
MERLGYNALWINGGQLDRLDRLTEVLAATRSVTVAPAVIPPDVFGPPAVERLFTRAEAAAPGRLLIGLGSAQTPGAIGRLYSDVDQLDAGIPRERRILAAFGPHKLGIARRHFLGAVPMLFTPAYTRIAREQLGAGPVLAVGQYVVVDTDPATARESARIPLRMLFTLPAYVNSALRQGFSRADIAALTDSVVDGFVAWGDPQQIGERIRRHHDAGADHVYLSVVHRAGQPDAGQAARLLAPWVLPRRSALHSIGT